MKTQTIDITTSDGVCDAYVAYPDQGSHPGVLLLMDGFGLRPYLHSMAEKLAAQGYYVLVPNLLYRINRAPVLDLKFPLKAEDMGNARALLGPIFKKFSAEESLKDVGALLEFLSDQKQVRPGKLGLTGYCLGGAMAIRAAGKFPEKIAAAASF